MFKHIFVKKNSTLCGNCTQCADTGNIVTPVIILRKVSIYNADKCSCVKKVDIKFLATRVGAILIATILFIFLFVKFLSLI